MTKVCNCCRESLPVEEFARHRNRHDGLQSMCRGCQRDHYLRNKDHRRVVQREAMLRRKYGIGQSDFVAMLEAQDGGCAICGSLPPEDGWLCVDHDHDTGAVRALLCDPCNTALGLMTDDPERLEAAAAYLRFHKESA